MPSLQIRKLPDEIYEALSLRARRERRSLAQQAIEELGQMPEVRAAERRRRQVRNLQDRLDRYTGRKLRLDSAEAVREDRDR